MYFLFFFFSGGESGRNSILLLSQLRTCINETHTWACQKRWEIRGGEKRSDPRGEKKKIDLCVSQICLKGKRRTKLQFSRKEGRKGALPTFNGVLRKLAQRRREFYRIFGAISGKGRGGKQPRKSFPCFFPNLYGKALYVVRFSSWVDYRSLFLFLSLHLTAAVKSSCMLRPTKSWRRPNFFFGSPTPPFPDGKRCHEFVR